MAPGPRVIGLLLAMGDAPLEPAIAELRLRSSLDARLSATPRRRARAPIAGPVTAHDG